MQSISLIGIPMVMKLKSTIVAFLLLCFFLSFSQNVSAQNISCAQLFSADTSTSSGKTSRFLADPEPPAITKYGFFVYKPKVKNNWVEKYVRYFPRKLGQFFLKDENYAFSPLRIFEMRPIRWLDPMNFADWATRKITFYTIKKEKILSKYVKIPAYVLLVTLSGVQSYAQQMETARITQDIANQPRYELISEQPQLQQSTESSIYIKDIRFEIVQKNTGSKPSREQFELLLNDYYKNQETQKNHEPSVLFGHIDGITKDLNFSQKTKDDLKTLTHMFYDHLQVQDEYFLQPKVYNQRKAEAYKNEDAELIDFMTRLENISLYNTIMKYYSEGLLTTEDVRYFTQRNLYNNYLVGIFEITKLNLTKVTSDGRYTESQLESSELTLALRLDILRKVRSNKETK